MADSFGKLDQALKDLIEAYTELEQQLDEKYGDDDEAFSNAVIEALETSIESALDDQDSDTGFFGGVLSRLSEALEQLDPAAFEGEEDEDEYEMEDADYDDIEEGELELEDEDEDQ